MRLWGGAWPKDAVESHFKLKMPWRREEHISARVALVHPDAVCELQTLAKAHGYKDTKVALVLADVAKAPAEHKVAWLQLHLKDKAPQLRKVALIPVGDRIARHAVHCGENYETCDCCGGDHSTMHFP